MHHSPESHAPRDGSERTPSNTRCTQRCLAAAVINHFGPDPANIPEFNVTTMSNPLDFKLD